MNIPKTLLDFESHSSGTIAELMEYFPKIKFFSEYKGTESVEVCAPIFPFYERDVLVDGKLDKVSFYRYYISDDIERRVEDNFNKYRTEEYLSKIELDFNEEF